jgi:virginiamycin B lyase
VKQYNLFIRMISLWKEVVMRTDRSLAHIAKPILSAVPVLIWLAFGSTAPAQEVRYYPVPKGAHPHDVAPAPDGTVWYTAQHHGALGWLDPKTGKVEQIPLGPGSAPHGVIVGPDRAAWVTDSGLNAIARVDPTTREVKVYPLPRDRSHANLNTAAFDGKGVLWFTGQSGVYGRLYPKKGLVEVFDAPRGRGPYGITATPRGEVYYASLAGSHIAHIDSETGKSTVIEPPTRNQGARRVWSDSKGRIWVSEWSSGQVSVYDPQGSLWKSWKLPGDSPRAYAVYVDESDTVWLTDFEANAIVRFDPLKEKFTSFPSNRRGANVRQLNGRPGEVWGAESGNDRLVVIDLKTAAKALPGKNAP